MSFRDEFMRRSREGGGLVNRGILANASVSGTFTAKLTEEDFEKALRILDRYPPPPSGVLASHKVPFGKLYRQWDTRGRLWLWVNRGWVQDLPRAENHDMIAVSVLVPPSASGIPVYYV